MLSGREYGDQNRKGSGSYERRAKKEVKRRKMFLYSALWNCCNETVGWLGICKYTGKKCADPALYLHRASIPLSSRHQTTENLFYRFRRQEYSSKGTDSNFIIIWHCVCIIRRGGEPVRCKPRGTRTLFIIYSSRILCLSSCLSSCRPVILSSCLS